MSCSDPKRILILGASGHCGQWLARLAVARGHHVRVLIRPAAVFPDLPGVAVLRGEALDPQAIDRALDGQQVVASCLGIRRAQPLNPWSRLLSPPDLTTRVTDALAGRMAAHGVRRLLAISAAGVADSLDQLSQPVRWLVRTGQVRTAYRDLAGMEEILAASRLDWLAVRPVTLVHGPPTGRARRVGRYGLFSVIRRSDVATWMLAALEEPEPYAVRRVLLGTSPWAPAAPHLASTNVVAYPGRKPALARQAQ